ncbi:helix-turn-helix transcriptional regulator [Sphingobacterium sp. LRF_L2]|uniref:helix-turn-helix transcriptional regulator n=1 Tax=Sphingobacterium sp. LRF_L2 TaxID=3369421 RepID=UPI003F5F6C44
MKSSDTIRKAIKDIERTADRNVSKSPSLAANVFDKHYSFEQKHLLVNESTILLEHRYIVYREWFVDEPVAVERKDVEPFLKMQFELEGGSYFEGVDADTTIRIGDKCHNIIFVAEPGGTLFYECSRKTLDILLDQDYFEKLTLDLSFTTLNRFKRFMRQGKTCQLMDVSREITPDMFAVIQRILFCKYKGQLQSLFMDAQIQTLLCLQLDQCLHVRGSSRANRTLDSKLAAKVKGYIDDFPFKLIYIKDLALIFNVDVERLRTVFKKSFGKSLYQYMLDQRLQYALGLLQSGDMQVKEVAYRIGYQHPQHFIKAFKNKFGYCPGSVIVDVIEEVL